MEGLQGAQGFLRLYVGFCTSVCPHGEWSPSLVPASHQGKRRTCVLPQPHGFYGSVSKHVGQVNRPYVAQQGKAAA